MAWLNALLGGRTKQDPRTSRQAAPEPPLAIERLESRTLLNASSSLTGGVLTILGSPGNDRINLNFDPVHNSLIVLDGGRQVASFASPSVNQVVIDAGDGNNVVRVETDVLQPATLVGGSGNDVLFAGGGPSLLSGGGGNNKLVAGPNTTALDGSTGNNHLFGGSGTDSFMANGTGHNLIYNFKPLTDSAVAGPNDTIVSDPGPPVFSGLLSASDVGSLLQRAAAASSRNDAIIAIVDRGGNILGVRVEGGVDPAITGNSVALTFAIDGAVAEARTAAFFANNQAPLTSRTIQFISQTTITQREVDSTPDVPDHTSTLYGPGFVAPIGVGAHFPPNIQFTPQVDLFAIENTNRDSILHPGSNGLRTPGNGILLPSRFNVPLQFIPPGVSLSPPESYGFNAFPATDPAHFAQARGIGTLPGGVPLFMKDASGNLGLVGGIGVFFPGKTGFASEENSSLSSNFDPTKPDLSLVAEYMAFAAAGGTGDAPIPNIAGAPTLPNFVLPPDGRIDLVGITLPLFGPNAQQGTLFLEQFGKTLGTGDPNSGFNAPLNTMGTTLLNGQPVPDGTLVTPHDGVSNNGLFLTAGDVNQIITQGVNEANQVRAAIRLPLGSRTRMVFAVSDLQGNIIGLFRMPDATIFSIDVAVAKARNVAYYANPNQLQPIDQVAGVPAGAALTNRTFRFLAGPRFPEGIDGSPPGPFSILNDGGANPFTGLQVGPPLPASAFQSVLGHDAFNPETNFRDPFNIANQNGVVFFPGSMPLYKTDANGNRVLVGGLGVSGDGVDQDDVITFAASLGFQPPDNLRADQFFVRGVRLPFQKFNRNPEG
jgi:uncharacterized protein GlcG (DUF336 family)